MDTNILYNLPDFANAAMPLGMAHCGLLFPHRVSRRALHHFGHRHPDEKRRMEAHRQDRRRGSGCASHDCTGLIDHRPEPALPLLASFCLYERHSPLTWGSIFLALDAIVCLAYTYFVLQENTKMARIWGLGGLPIAIAGHGYTGFFLALSKARAFWNTALNPALFMVSAMVSGLAVLIVLSNLWLRRYAPEMSEEQVAKHKGVIGTLLRLFIIFIVADLFLIGSDLTVLASSDTESYAMLQLLTTGEYAIWFLGIELLLGAVLPLGLLAHPKTRMIPAVQYASAALVIIGIFVMRVIIVIGGQSVHLT